jgi:hypothetical protein
MMTARASSRLLVKVNSPWASSLVQRIKHTNLTFTKALTKRASEGKIIVRVNPIKKSSQEIEMKLGARDLPMVSSCCSSSITPFIVIDKSFTVAGKENYTAVHKTEVNYQNINNPSFSKFKLKA